MTDVHDLSLITGADSHSHSAPVVSSSSTHYAAQLRSCEMRHVILRNEMDEVVLEEELVAKRKTKIKNGEYCCCVVLCCVLCWLFHW